ncbi:MAG: DUF3604 domain-containing protein [Deltaproteobacteria bacterium]|jgi:hypothetical protein|nr:DUF3604 domain-containing protein [Deltaproteobacteria bacterium]
MGKRGENRRGGGGRILLAVAGLASSIGCGAEPPQETYEIQGDAKPAGVVEEIERRQQLGIDALAKSASGRRASQDKQILFGDLHVHSTFSFDAYLFSLPAFGGEGVHPPADACDFARYCANLDFFALTDHAETMRPEHWRIAKQSLRDCNERAGDPSNPDLVAFMGFEWSQAGLTPETHFGHRCVVFPETADEKLPPRPIASDDRRVNNHATATQVSKIKWLDPLNWARYEGYLGYTEALLDYPVCDEDVPSSELPLDCLEVAPTPEVLHRKLDEWGGEALDIPHGTAWGIYTPATTSIDKHLAPENFDPERQRLIEIMSGHGNSEEYRPWREWELGASGERICPEPTEDYLPCCWQAGEIMRGRCEGLTEVECEERVELARSYAMEAWTRPHQIFPDAEPEEWLDCGQCRDCFKPAYGLRPRESVQYAMSLTHPEALDEEGEPLRFRYGFVGSSDEHSSRPGVGYKAVDRGLMTDVNEAGGAAVSFLLSARGDDVDPQMPQRPGSRSIALSGNDARVQAFLFPGGLAAVHSESRSRRDLWDAMQRREVYATSGPRILLWFDLVNAPDGDIRPMGSEVVMLEAPEFEVRALGSFEPKPGCPDWTREGLGASRIADLCHDECYFPSDVRRPIEAVEVVRITPRIRAGEEIDPLIEDPWRRFECEGGSEGCVVRFRDETFSNAGRDRLYYVRAIEPARPAILGDPLRPERNREGEVVSIELCEMGDDCLDEARERAWSSPIFVDHAGRRAWRADAARP